MNTACAFVESFVFMGSGLAGVARAPDCFLMNFSSAGIAVLASALAAAHRPLLLVRGERVALFSVGQLRSDTKTGGATRPSASFITANCPPS